MIKVGNKEINIKHFPDGSQLLNDCNIYDWETNCGYYDIFWRYESDEELVALIYVVSHLRNNYKDAKIALYMPYIPNARMDRTKKINEVFTLKYFANVINSLNFDKIYVLDPHSDVSVGLLNNISILDIDKVISKVVNWSNNNAKAHNHELLIFFPDAGAYKRYKDLDCLKGFRKIYGNKVRDWSSGKILGLNVVDENGENLSGDKPLSLKYVLMIDDIISYGGTLYHAAIKLNSLGAENIDAYATHVESDSIWDEENGTFRKCLEPGSIEGSTASIVKVLYTTNSIYKYFSSDKVYVLNVETLFKND